MTSPCTKPEGGGKGEKNRRTQKPKDDKNNFLFIIIRFHLTVEWPLFQNPGCESVYSLAYRRHNNYCRTVKGSPDR